MTPNSRGALLMMLSMSAFTLNDACMKSLSDQIPLFQAVFLRGIFTSLTLAIAAAWLGAFSVALSRRDWMLVGIRSLAEVAAAYFFISALFKMPIANVTAILQALPLTVTLAGAMFFGEKVGWKRMLAILVGFLGVLLIVKPGAEGFNSYAVYAVIAVIAVTIRDLAARRLSHEVPSMTVALSAAVLVTGFGGLGLLTQPWAPVGGTEALQLAGTVFFVIGGYLFSVMAMRIGEISVVAPFRYFSLLCALVLGLLVFGEWPDSLTLIGSAIVVATGVFTFYRERRLARGYGPVGLRIR
ncbi:MAG: DMT family transporter [Paracoccaceae bacterium]